MNEVGKARGLYLDLLARVLTRSFDEDNDEVIGVAGADPTTPRPVLAEQRDLAERLALGGLELVRRRPFDAEMRRLGRDWPARAETMMGLERLANVRHCVETVLEEGVPGDLLEAGVWRGGGALYMKAVLEAHGDDDRVVWLADSFAGLPPPSADFPADAGLLMNDLPYLAVSEEQVRHNFVRYGLLDERVRFLRGWFKDTLPSAPVQQLAVLRLDGDLYESTWQALDALYPRLAPGGFCIVDDYGLIRACRKAVHHYRARHGIKERIVDVDGWGAFWRKAPQPDGAARA